VPRVTLVREWDIAVMRRSRALWSEITVELIEADETPAVVIVSWPVKPTVLHPRRFPDVAAAIATLAADANTALAAIKTGRRL
jgi:hypothetical protein